MKQTNGKFFLVIGILLLIAGIILFPDDPLIGVIGIFLGMYNVVKGFQLTRGIQPLFIRKQQEYEQKREEEIKEEIDNKRRNDQQNKRNQ